MRQTAELAGFLGARIVGIEAVTRFERGRLFREVKRPARFG